MCDNRCVLNDTLAQQVEAIWRTAFPDAAILPVIGYPSYSGGVMTLTHTDGSGVMMRINVLMSKSPLANNALYSTECSEGQYLNLYEIMIPDIPGKHGRRSTAQIYNNALQEEGLDVSAKHFHWTGSTVYKNDHLVAAVHHQAIGMHPVEFTHKTIRALKKALAAIQRRAIPYKV